MGTRDRGVSFFSHLDFSHLNLGFLSSKRIGFSLFGLSLFGNSLAPCTRICFVSLGMTWACHGEQSLCLGLAGVIRPLNRMAILDNRCMGSYSGSVTVTDHISSSILVYSLVRTRETQISPSTENPDPPA